MPLGGCALSVVEALMRAEGNLVTKDALIAQNTIVEENALQVHISAIRRALGPDRTLLQTAFGRGYRLIGAWRIVSEEAQSAGSSARQLVHCRRREQGTGALFEPARLHLSPRTRRAAMTHVETPESAPRRSVLLGAGLFAGSLVLAARSPAHAAAAPGDVQVMQGALALEHEGIAAYRLAGASGLLQPDTLKVAVLFKGHHEQHRDALAELIRKAGGKPVEPKGDTDYVKELNLEALKTQTDVVRLATKLELGATNAYAGQVAALHDPKLAHLFAQLSADEAVHWTTLNNAAGTPIPTKAFLFG